MAGAAMMNTGTGMTCATCCVPMRLVAVSADRSEWIPDCSCWAKGLELPPRTDSVRIYPGPSCEHTERIAALEMQVVELARRIALFETTAHLAESLGLIHDRRTSNRRTASDVPVPSRRGKGRRK